MHGDSLRKMASVATQPLPNDPFSPPFGSRITRPRPVRVNRSRACEQPRPGGRSLTSKKQIGRCGMQGKAQIDQVLRQKSDAREIPGVVAMAATGNEVTYQGAVGKRDLSEDDGMTADSVFWIASMAKASRGCGRPGIRSRCATS